MTLENIPEGDWVKLNTGAVGFYRTQYSSDMLAALLPGIQNQKLPPRDRLGLQNDLFALARSGELSTVEVLRVAQAFSTETNYTVWSDLSGNLSVLSVLLQYTDYHDDFKAFLRKLFTPISEKLGWDPIEGEGHLDAMLRSTVIGRMGRAGDEKTVAEAKKRFKGLVDGTLQIPADLRTPVYSTVLSNGGEEEFDSVLKLFRAADLHEEKVRLMSSLGAVREEALIKRTLKFAMSEEVRSQDTVFVIGGVTGSKLGRDLAWQFIKDNWSDLYERYKGGFLLARLIKSTSENFVSDEMAKDVQVFFETHPAPAADRTIQQAVENIRLNRSQLERDSEAIKSFLQS